MPDPRHPLHHQPHSPAPSKGHKWAKKPWNNPKKKSTAHTDPAAPGAGSRLGSAPAGISLSWPEQTGCWVLHLPRLPADDFFALFATYLKPSSSSRSSRPCCSPARNSPPPPRVKSSLRKAGERRRQRPRAALVGAQAHEIKAKRDSFGIREHPEDAIPTCRSQNPTENPTGITLRAPIPTISHPLLLTWGTQHEIPKEESSVLDPIPHFNPKSFASS